MDARQTADTGGQVQSLVRALSALDELARHPEGLTLTKLASLVNLPRSTTHRLMTTMNTLQFVVFDRDTNFWMIGPQAFTVGSAFRGARDLTRIGRPFLRALNLKSSETINLSVEREGSLVYLCQERASHDGPVTLRTGDRLPLHQAAAGKAIMAFWRDRQLAQHLETADLSGRTPSLQLDRSGLADSLGGVRASGIAFDHAETLEDVHCVGVPVFNDFGEPVAALSISAPCARMGAERMDSLGRELRLAAVKLTRGLGGRLPQEFYG